MTVSWHVQPGVLLHPPTVSGSGRHGRWYQEVAVTAHHRPGTWHRHMTAKLFSGTNMAQCATQIALYLSKSLADQHPQGLRQANGAICTVHALKSALPLRRGVSTRRGVKPCIGRHTATINDEMISSSMGTSTFLMLLVGSFESWRRRGFWVFS